MFTVVELQEAGCVLPDRGGGVRVEREHRRLNCPDPEYRERRPWCSGGASGSDRVLLWPPRGSLLPQPEPLSLPYLGNSRPANLEAATCYLKEGPGMEVICKYNLCSFQLILKYVYLHLKDRVREPFYPLVT